MSKTKEEIEQLAEQVVDAMLKVHRFRKLAREKIKSWRAPPGTSQSLGESLRRGIQVFQAL